MANAPWLHVITCLKAPHIQRDYWQKNVNWESGHVRPRQGTEICHFGAPSPLHFFNFLQWIFSLFSRFTVQFSKEMGPKYGEICPISGRRKKRRILSRLWLSWFFRSRGNYLWQNCQIKPLMMSKRMAVIHRQIWTPTPHPWELTKFDLLVNSPLKDKGKSPENPPNLVSPF